MSARNSPTETSMGFAALAPLGIELAQRRVSEMPVDIDFFDETSPHADGTAPAFTRRSSFSGQVSLLVEQDSQLLPNSTLMVMHDAVEPQEESASSSEGTHCIDTRLAFTEVGLDNFECDEISTHEKSKEKQEAPHTASGTATQTTSGSP